MRALVIVGHGSHLNGDSSLPVYEHAGRIRETGEFDEVVECFWKGEKTVRYAGPLGTFEGMPDVILERTQDLMRGKEVSGRTALILLGHGTDLNKNSGGVIYLNAGCIRERGIYDLVEVGFLDQDPEIGGVVDRVEAQNVILIPLFIAEGWHTRETIPEDLGLVGEVTVRDDKTIFYGAPVGTHPSMANLIIARARGTMTEQPVV